MLMMTFSPISSAAFDRGRAHVGQQQHVIERQQLGIHGRFMLEDIQAGTGQICLSRRMRVSGLFVDHFATGGIHDDGGVLQQLQAARRQQVEGAGVCGQLTEMMSMRASI